MKHPLTISYVTDAYKRFQEIELAKKEIDHILQFTRQHDMFASVDDYCEAKRTLIALKKALMNQKREILKGAYINT